METLCFEEFELDLGRRELRRDGEPVSVQPLVLDLIAYLATRPGRVVPRQALLERVWGGVTVSDAAVDRAVSAARRALGDRGDRQALIQTERGQGYRFCAETRPGKPASAGDPFVGRESELATVDALLDQLREGRGGALLVAGDPGIGKSRLARELRQRARAGGALVLVGRCPESEGAPPYWPWTQALRDALPDADGRRGRLSPHTAAVIARAMPELAERLPEASEADVPPELPALAARLRLIEHLRSAWQTLTDERPTVLVFDDVHRADLDSLELIASLVPNWSERPVLLVATYRDAPLRSDPRRANLIGTLARSEGTRSLTLRGLGRSAVAELASRVQGAPLEEEALERIEAATAGNPFYLLQLLRGGPESHGLGLAAAVRDHLGIVGAKCGELLTQAAVLGRRFHLRILAEAIDATPAELVPILEEAVRARLLDAEGVDEGRYRFAHALIADQLYDDLSAELRAERHARASEALLRVDGEPALPEAAHHAARGAPAGRGERAFELCLRAAEQAGERLAYREASRLLQEARGLQRWLPPDARRDLELLLGLGEMELRAGEVAEAREHFEQAAEAAREQRDPAALARAAVGYAGDQDDARANPRAVELLEQGLAELPKHDSTLLAQVIGRLATAVYSLDLDRSRRLAADALEVARRTGDEGAVAGVLRILLFVAKGPDEADALQGWVQELLDIGRRGGDLAQEEQARGYLLDHALEWGDRDRFDAEFDTLDRIARRSRNPLLEFFVAHYETMVTLIDGDLLRAEECLANASALGARTGYEVATTYHAIQLWGLRREQGRLGELDALMVEAARRYPATPWRFALALQRARDGEPETGSRALASLRESGLGVIRRDSTWLAALQLVTELAARLGASDVAAEAYELLLPHAGRHVRVGMNVLYLGSVEHVLGIAARAAGAEEDAERWLRSAVERESAFGAPAAAARSELELLRGGAPGDGGRDEALRRLRTRARERGWRGLWAEIDPA